MDKCILCEQEIKSNDKIRRYGLKIAHDECAQELLDNWDME